MLTTSPELPDTVHFAFAVSNFIVIPNIEYDSPVFSLISTGSKVFVVSDTAMLQNPIREKIIIKYFIFCLFHENKVVLIISLYRLLFSIIATHNAKISGASFCVLWFFLLAVLLLMPFTLEKEIATATSIATQHQILEIPHSYKH